MLAIISIALRQEWTLLPLLAWSMSLKRPSVGVASFIFKYRKNAGEGRRIFRMTPFPSPFELED